jgi:S1-C subfamily serine protease
MQKTLIAVIVLFLLALPVQADQPTEEQKTINATEKLTQSTVVITVGLDKGTGFYIADDKILTAWHVVKGKETVTVQTGNKYCTGYVKDVDGYNDLATLRTDCKGTPLELAKSSKAGQTVISVGHPGSSKYVATKGIISGYEKNHVTSDIRIREGMSGGALMNLDGEVVGVMTAYLILDPAMAYGASLDTVRDFIERE